MPSRVRAVTFSFPLLNSIQTIMAQFLPFRGLRYDTQKVELSRRHLPALRRHQRRRARRPNRARPAQHRRRRTRRALRRNRFARPIRRLRYATWKQWIAEGILVRDDSSFYLYEQEFPLPGSAASRQTARRFGRADIGRIRQRRAAARTHSERPQGRPPQSCCAPRTPTLRRFSVCLPTMTRGWRSCSKASP